MLYYQIVILIFHQVTKMQDFKELNKLLVNELKYSDSNTIEKANKLINNIEYSIRLNHMLSERKRLKNRKVFDEKILICLEYFGLIPFSIRLLELNFLRWCCYREVVLREKHCYYQSLWQNFCNDVNRSPKDLDEVLKYDSLDIETKVKITIKNNRYVI